MQNNSINSPKVPFIFIVLTFIPPLHLGILVFLIYKFLLTLKFTYIFASLIIVYLVPPLLYRIMIIFAPLHRGRMLLTDKKSWPWLIAIKLQMLFIAFPIFEQLLILFPEAFSLWLRLWGSRIGKMVVWSHHVRVVDRTHLSIGNYVLFGERATLASHIIIHDSKTKEASLLFDEVIIGSNVLVGTESAIGPGCRVNNTVQINFREILYPYTRRGFNKSKE